MTSLLTFLGDLLYFFISLLILPLLTFAYCLMGAWTAYHYFQRHKKQYFHRLEHTIHEVHLAKRMEHLWSGVAKTWHR
jgi:hypothetical protein